MNIKKRIEAFNENNRPFYIVDHDDGKFSLCLPLDLLRGEYEDFGQAAFDAYALEIGEPPMDSRGFQTHGNGYEWEAAFRQAFADDPNIDKILFDCEAGGFFCYTADLSLLEEYGAKFRKICTDTEKFTPIVSQGIKGMEQWLAEQEKLMSTVRGAFLENPRTRTGAWLQNDDVRRNEIMSIKHISVNDLRAMANKEGLILQGCGGDLNEWVDGINDLLTEEGILLDGTKFEHCAAFTHDGVTCILYSFEDVKLDVGKLAMWRLHTYGQFGSTWLSDYVPNCLGGFIEQKAKPDCALIGEDGNIFNLVGLAARTLHENGMTVEASEMTKRVYASDNYDKALGIIGEYVNITSAEDMDEDFDEEYGMDMHL